MNPKKVRTMRLDCEIISQDFLPVLRAVLAKELSSCGLNQKDVANILGISQPAVSQYLRDLRGSRNHFVSDEELYMKIKELCGKIRTKEMNQTQMKNEMYAVCERAMIKKRI